MQKFLNHKATAILLPAIIGLGGAALSVVVFEDYGWSLFLGLPILVSFLAAFAWCYKREKTYRSAYGVATWSTLTLGCLIIIFALDGLICLLMALPLTLLLATIGTALGRLTANSLSDKTGTSIATLLALSFPLLVGFDHATAPEPKVRSVTTSVIIDAPIGDVWAAVIAFPEITAPPEGIFRLGIAYPIEATIHGHGVGAIRHCTFSTGDFVEPITTWDAPHHLAFSVTENPPPMNELSIYHDMHAPHLHGHMLSQKGEFRLTQTGNKVTLEGTTWYTHSIAPEFYWSIISDEIIHRIHLRVLNHIKTHTEKNQ
ncbi:MAG: hypothetical protein ACSHX6_03730 [Akkermansiaceae bacterium]